MKPKKTKANQFAVSLLIWGLLSGWWGIFFHSTPLRAAPMSQDRFNLANQLYEKGDYPAALTIYRELEKKGSHWKLFFNCGNCYFKLNQWVNAKIYYLKARRLAPFEPSVAKNIEIVNNRLSDKISAPPPDFISRLVLRIESFFSLNVLSIMLLIAMLGFNGFVFLALSRGSQRWINYGIAFSLVFLIFMAAYHIYRVDKFQDRDVAVITSADTQLRSGPGANNTILFKVNGGLEVRIIGASSDKRWLQVSATNEIAGWVEADYLTRIGGTQYHD